ncbi:MAG: hypothetical protein JNK82_01215 [Myxococcaceae bacterium]|nr:hypothetical protein [Myxococcaceae bacterium]
MMHALVAVALLSLPREYTESFEGELFEADGGWWYRAQLEGGNTVYTSPSAARSGDRGFVSADTYSGGTGDEAGNQAMLIGAGPQLGARVWWRTWLRVDSVSWAPPIPATYGRYVSVGGTLTTNGYPGASVGLDDLEDGGLGLYLSYVEGEALTGRSFSANFNVERGRWYLVETFQGGIGTGDQGEIAMFVNGERRGGRLGQDFTMDGGIHAGVIGVGFQFPRPSVMQMSYDEHAVRTTPPPSRLRVRALDAGASCNPVEVALVSSADGGLAGALTRAGMRVTATGGHLHASADCLDAELQTVGFDAGETAKTFYACAVEDDVTVSADEGSYLPGSASFRGARGGECAPLVMTGPGVVNPSLYSICSLAPGLPLLALALLMFRRRGATTARTS